MLKWRDGVKKDTCFSVGSGANILILEDHWIPSILGFKPSPYPNYGDNLLVSRVADLIDPDSGQWNCSLFWSVFCPEHEAEVVKIQLSVSSCCDNLVWIFEKSERFTVKSIYREIVKNRIPLIALVEFSWWKKLWKMKVHDKLKTAMWKLLWDVIPTKSKVAERLGGRDMEDVICEFCGGDCESIHHLLLDFYGESNYLGSIPLGFGYKGFPGSTSHLLVTKDY